MVGMEYVSNSNGKAATTAGTRTITTRETRTIPKTGSSKTIIDYTSIFSSINAISTSYIKYARILSKMPP